MTEMYHHGIKGQKWGVRRFQNRDGSLTEEGKKRQNRDKSEIERINMEGKAQKNIVSGARDISSGVERLSTSQPRNRYNKRKNLTQDEIDAMSNKELQELVTRMNLEAQYSMLTSDKTAQHKVSEGLQQVNAILSVVGGVVTIASAYKLLRG